MNATAWKNTDEHAQWKKLVTKDDTSSDCIYVKCPE